MIREHPRPRVLTGIELEEHDRRGGVGDVEAKHQLIQLLDDLLGPIRERRRAFEARPDFVAEALIAGSDQGRRIAERTMQEVRDAMRINHYEAPLVGGRT